MKTKTCKACGEEIAKKAKKCPHCGAKNKKPFYKKIGFWLFVFIIIGSMGGESDTVAGSAPTTPPTTQSTTKLPPKPNKPTTEPTTEPSAEATTEPVVEEETLSGAEAADLVMTMIELTIADKFDYYKVEGDETGITLSIATEGVVQELTTAKYSGYDENYAPWVEAKENFVYLCNSIYDSAVEFGMDDPVISVCVLNDQNHDNIVLMIMNGVVVYDVLAE